MALSANVQIKLSRLNAELSAIFAEGVLTRELATQIQLVQEFYHNELTESVNGDKNQPRMKQYETLINTLKSVKAGELSIDEAEKVIDDSTYNGKKQAVIHNLLKTCELLFWLSTAFTCYLVCVAVGIPLISFEPVMGVLLTAGTFHSSGASLHKATTCIDEFKSFAPINQEDRRERKLFQFFVSEPPIELAPEDVVAPLYPVLND